MTTRVYKLPPRFYDDHQARALPENQQAISRIVGDRNARRLQVELDELGFDELMSDATYYANEMRSAGYGDQGVISSARATVRALEQQGRPEPEPDEHELRLERYRVQVRETFQRFSDQALAYQSGIIRGGIDRQECDAELDRRRAGGQRVVS